MGLLRRFHPSPVLGCFCEFLPKVHIPLAFFGYAPPGFDVCSMRLRFSLSFSILFVSLLLTHPRLTVVPTHPTVHPVARGLCDIAVLASRPPRLPRRARTGRRRSCSPTHIVDTTPTHNALQIRPHPRRPHRGSRSHPAPPSPASHPRSRPPTHRPRSTSQRRHNTPTKRRNPPDGTLHPDPRTGPLGRAPGVFTAYRELPRSHHTRRSRARAMGHRLSRAICTAGEGGFGNRNDSDGREQGTVRGFFLSETLSTCSWCMVVA